MSLLEGMGKDLVGEDKTNRITEILKRGDVAKALAQFEERIQRQGSLPLSAVNALILWYVKHGPIDKAFYIFREMQDKMRLQPNLFTYRTLLEGCMQNNLGETAVSLFEEMIAKKIPLDATVFNVIMGSYAKRPKEKTKVFDYLRVMKSMKIAPDVITLTTVLDVCLQCNDLEKAFSYFEEMKQDPQTHPTAITYNTLIDGCMRLRKKDLCDALLEEMKKDPQTQPTEVTYNILMKGWKTDPQLLAKGFDLLEEIKRDSIPYSNVTYNILLDGCMKTHQVDKAFALFEEMKQDPHARPTEVSYNTLISGCIKEKQLDKALSLFEEMKNQRVKQLKPSRLTCNILINAYLHAGQVEDAMKLFTHMEAKLTPDEVTYRCFIFYYVRQQDIAEAKNWVERMNRKGLRPDRPTRLLLIKLAQGNASLTEEEKEALMQLPTNKD